MRPKGSVVGLLWLVAGMGLAASACGVGGEATDPSVTLPYLPVPDSDELVGLAAEPDVAILGTDLAPGSISGSTDGPGAIAGDNSGEQLSPEAASFFGGADDIAPRRGLRTPFTRGATMRVATDAPPDLAARLVELEGVLDRLDGSCDSVEQRLALWDEIGSALDRISDRPDVFDLTGGEWVRPMTVEVTDSIIGGGCDDRLAIEPTPEVMRATRALVSAVDRFVLAVLPPTAVHQTRIWNLDVHAVLASALGGDPAEVLVVGSSVARMGVSADLLAERLDRPVVNVGISGGFGEFQEVWLPEVRSFWPTEEVVLVVSSLDLLAPCDPEPRARQFELIQRRRFDAFPEVTGPVGPRRVGLLIGDGAESPIVAETERRRIDPARDADELDAGDVARQLDFYSGAARIGAVCEERLRLQSGLVGQLADEGVRVVVAVLPTSVDIEALHPGGSVGMAADRDAWVRQLARAGAQVVDLAELDRSLLADATHLGREGRRQATEAIAQQAYLG